jgi:hypothetical protein
MKPTLRMPSLWQRAANWAGDRVAQMIWAGRTRKIPGRETTAYSRLMNMGRYQKDRPLIKPTPGNLRQFSRTVHARRAINRIKNIIAGLEWEIVPKAGVDLSRELQGQIDVVTACFQHPNRDDSFQTLIEQVIEDYLICGAGAIEPEVGGDPVRPLWMWPVDALSIQVYAAWTGDKNEARYLQTYGNGNIGGQQGIPLRNDQLIYIRKDPNTDNPFGNGCLETAFNSINRQLAAADYAGNVAGNGQPENMLQFMGADPVTLDRMRDWWRNEIEGQGQTPLVGGDEIKVHKLRGGNDDALFIKYQELLIREIATAFELSPQNFGVEADVNRSTSEVSEDRDWSGIIIPTARNLASYLTREAIDRKLGFSQIKFKWLGIDRDDEELLANIHETYWNCSALTPDEIREKLGLPPLESKWGSMLKVDMDIAVIAAKGVAKDVDDPDLGTKPTPKKPKPKAKAE